MVNFKEIREKFIKDTKSKVKEAVNADIIIIQAINMIDDLNKVLNTLAKRLREWHAYSLPELEHQIEDNETYCKLIATKSYEELKEEFGCDTMGNVIDQKDVEIQEDIGKIITKNYELRTSLSNYVEELMKKHLPNVQILAGTNIGARLLVSAGSFKKLAMMPASTIQMLGAEKALFRHLKSGAKPPKHGFIINHPLVASAGKDKGKVARVLADKISQCAKIDFFKGELIANKFRDELNKKFLK